MNELIAQRRRVGFFGDGRFAHRRPVFPNLGGLSLFRFVSAPVAA
jgi:hypothetical protein